MIQRLLLASFLVLVAASTSSCSSMYYSAMESMGREKREILVSRVKSASEDQTEAKEQFASALEKFQAVLGKDGGDLEKKYRQLESEYSDCKSRAEDVDGRIKSIEDVSKSLFKEWESELDEYTNETLRASSEKRLRETRAKYDTMLGAMTRASGKAKPVLAAFHDHVLFLKHNLNAQAIASLQDDVGGMDDDVKKLIADMEASIAESQAFLDTMEGAK